MMRRALALLLLLGACTEEVPIVGPVGLNRCTTNSDCRDGTCDLSSRRCVASARTEVFFRIVPPAARQGPRDLIATVTAPRALRSGETLDLTLRQARVVYGTVAAPLVGAPKMGASPVAATVIFTTSDGPGVFPAVETIAQPMLLPALRGETLAHTYAATMPDGLFDVVVAPLSQIRALLPPQFISRFDVRSDNLQQRFDVGYPTTFARWAGTVRNRSGAPIPGLSVRAVDAARNDLDVSTLNATGQGANAGRFSVALAVGAPADWALRVTSNVNRRGGLVLQVPRAVCARLDAEGREIDLSLPTDLGLPQTGATPCSGCVQVSATVEGRSAAGVSRTLRNVTVTLRTAVPLGDSPLAPESRAWFEDRVQTDGDGSFTTWLIPGDYDVTLEPFGDEYGNAVSRAFRVRADVERQMGQVFTVTPRLPVEGRVLTATGQPVANARVRAIPFAGAYAHHACLDDPDLATLSPRANPDETTSGADGSYRLDVDPGLYQIVIEPPSATGFATDLGRTECIASGMRSLDLVLESPVTVRGRVRDPSMRAVPGAIIEAAVRVRQPGAPGVSLRVARATAGPDGAYTLLLPSSTALSP
jgi:protocatechuate 3,4-dioxygenase beta subunit